MPATAVWRAGGVGSGGGVAAPPPERDKCRRRWRYAAERLRTWRGVGEMRGGVLRLKTAPVCHTNPFDSLLQAGCVVA